MVRVIINITMMMMMSIIIASIAVIIVVLFSMASKYVDGYRHRVGSDVDVGRMWRWRWMSTKRAEVVQEQSADGEPDKNA